MTTLCPGENVLFIVIALCAGTVMVIMCLCAVATQFSSLRSSTTPTFPNRNVFRQTHHVQKVKSEGGQCKILNVRHDLFTLLLNVQQKNGLPNCLVTSQACSHHCLRLRLALAIFNACCHFHGFEQIFWARVCLCISRHKPYTKERQCLLCVDL